MKKNYDYEEIERWAKRGFTAAEAHARYTPKRADEKKTVNMTEGGFFRSVGFQIVAVALVAFIVSAGTFGLLKYMEHIADINNPAQSGTVGITEPVQTVSTGDPHETSGDETKTETETGTDTEAPCDENGKYPAYLSVTCGSETIYPDAYMLFTEEYDDENGVWLSADGIGAAGAEHVPLIRYDGTEKISMDCYSMIDIGKMLCSCSGNGKEYKTEYYVINDFFATLEDGVYRFVAKFVITGRQIGSQYERRCYEYPFDVEVKRGTVPAGDWDGLTKTERIERALDEITTYGINYQRWRYLCGADRADDIYDDGGYYIDDPAEAEFTYDYLLGRYDSETDPDRRVLMFVFISYYLEATWDDSEHGFPYSLKYMPSGDTFKKPVNLSEDDVSGCDEWLRVKYYGEFCKYASQMKENDVKTKYKASYKLIKKYGFNDFSDSAKTPERTASRTVQEFFNMALSVKYGIAVTDPASERYYNRDETGSGLNVYGPGDKVYRALLKYYPEELLDADSNNAPFACEQRAGIKYINDWRSYFTSLTSKEIADGFIKESKCFLTTSDGLVLTVDNYYFFNTNNFNTPSVGSFSGFESNGKRATARVRIYEIGENRTYTVEFSAENGVYKITGGTLVTEWLERTLSAEECQIRDTVMDIEHLFQIINSGVVNGFRYYGFDDVYNIEYGKNENLPEGLEEALNEKSVYEMLGKTHYISDRVFHSSYGLRTYDDWIRYFSNILPADLVKAYIKEAPLYAHHGRDVYSFLIVNNEVYLLERTPQSWYEIDYSTFRIIGEKDGVTTVSAVLTGIYTASVSQNNFEVTFELVKTDDASFRYRVTGGTFVDMFMKSGANVSKAAHSAYKLIRASDLLLCADASVVYIEKYYKYSGEADGSAYVAYNYYGKEMFSDLLDFSTTEQIKNAVMKDTEVMKWVEDDQHIFYPVIYPDRAEFTIRPKFAETQDMTVHGLIENMKNYKETDEKITFSLDFVLQYKNGKTKNVTYTFEIDKTDGCRVTGGTFVTDFILAK